MQDMIVVECVMITWFVHQVQASDIGDTSNAYYLAPLGVI